MLSEIARIKRRRILDAALCVFSEKGFHNATISEVARAAHVGKGTVYLYFDGKESLLVEIFSELVDHMIDVFDQIALRGARLQEVVSEIVSRKIEAGRIKGQLAHLLAQQPFLSTMALQDEKRSLIQRVVQRLADRVQQAIDDDVIEPCDPTLAASLLLNLPGVISLYDAAAPDSALPESLPEIAEKLSNILWIGLRKETQ